MNLSEYQEQKKHRLKRLLWLIVNNTIFRVLIGGQLRYIRNLILRCFGAELPLHVMVYPDSTIFAPWNLTMKAHSCIGPRTKIYNKVKYMTKI